MASAESATPNPKWERVRRLDPAAMTAAVAAATGIDLQVVGPCPGGQVGAAYVRWPDRHLSVLKWRPAVPLRELRAGPFAVLDAARAIGYPAPAIELAVPVEAAVVTVQELVPGQPLDYLDAAILDQALALNQLQAGLLAGRPGIGPLRLYLTQDGPGFCLHGPAREYSARTARLERWVRSVGAQYGDQLTGDDAVHGDFHPGNFLATDGAINGVIDWDGAARGHRGFDLVTLRIGWLGMRSDAATLRRLDAELDALPAHVLLPAWAHMSMRLADWAIRHFGPAELSYWLTVAEQRMS